jgi:2-hydroxychromene-2-carboxylate isomerase
VGLSCQIWFSVLVTAPGLGASQVGQPGPASGGAPPPPPAPELELEELEDEDEELDAEELDAPPAPELEDELDEVDGWPPAPPELVLENEPWLSPEQPPCASARAPVARKPRKKARGVRAEAGRGRMGAENNAKALRGASWATLHSMKRLELFYDFACPYAYLASTQIEAIAARTGAELVWRPMLLGGVFKAIGTADGPSFGPAKARLNHLDMHRAADHLGVPLCMPPMHPSRTVLALRATLAAEADAPRATHALFRAYWVLGRDLSRPEVVRDALAETGLDGAALVARAEDSAIKEALRARTDEAVARGVFGAPTCIVTTEDGSQLFWGQDRLFLVEKALGGQASHLLPAEPSGPPTVSEVSFFFDVSSPYAYLASTQIEAVAARNGARARFRPFLLGALFKAVGTAEVPLFEMPPPKRAHAALDLARFAAHYGVPFSFPSRFPMNTVKALRMILQVPDEQKPTLTHALFRALWVEDRDLADDAALIAIAGEAGFDGASLVAGTKVDAVKERLKQATADAVAAGLCGAPSFLVGDLLFWGQDRLLYVEKALRGWHPRGE